MILEIKQIIDPIKILSWRIEVLKSVFSSTPSLTLIKANQSYIARHLNDDTLYFLTIELDTVPAGCGAICFHEELPSPDNPSGGCGFIMNIYVRPGYRSKGLASLLISHLITEAHSRNVGKIYLESTPEAADIYRHLGFRALENYFYI